VWIKRAGPAWQGVHGVTADEYQSFISKWTAQGYSPTIVSAVGAGNDDVIFAAVLEKGAFSKGWFAIHGHIWSR
jgi:hypothetical protein